MNQTYDPLKIFITGGVSFISNLVEYFLKNDRVTTVPILDELSSGYLVNIQEFDGHPSLSLSKVILPITTLV